MGAFHFFTILKTVRYHLQLVPNYAKHHIFFNARHKSEKVCVFGSNNKCNKFTLKFTIHLNAVRDLPDLKG